MNVHIGEPNTSKLTSMHFYAWKKGLKTGMYYLRTRPKADAIQFTVNQEMLAETTQNPAVNSPRKSSSPTSVASGPKASLSSKFASLAMKDEEEECLNCGA
jgi:ribonucleotide reductase alpha subunit